MNNIKSGWKTTEFWGSLAVGAAVVISSLEGALPPKYAALAGTLVAGLYSLSRGLAKLNAALSGIHGGVIADRARIPASSAVPLPPTVGT